MAKHNGIARLQGNTQGGAYIGENLYVHGNFVGRDNYNFFGALYPNDSKESSFRQTIEEARKKLDAGQLPPALVPEQSTLFYCKRIRPRTIGEAITDEVEVQIAVRNSTSWDVEVLDIHPPQGVEPIREPWVFSGKISSFATQIVMSYVIDAPDTNRSVEPPPLTYQLYLLKK